MVRAKESKMTDEKNPSPGTDQNSMVLTMDPNVKRVVEFMQRELPADKLRGIAQAVAVLSPAIWGHQPDLSVRPVCLMDRPVTG